MSSILLVSRALAAEPEPSWGCLGTGNAVGYLLLALMLALLLLLRVHRRQEEVRRPVSRANPRSLDDLGTAVIRALRQSDLPAYRQLYATLPELEVANHPDLQLFGERYTGERIRQCMEASARRLPEGAEIESAFRVGRDALAVRLRLLTGENQTMILGTVAEFKGVFRLLQQEGAAPGPARSTRR
ncbi:MAG: hypothetical protein ABIO70_21620 [Pseudomonadota bacterium]